MRSRISKLGWQFVSKPGPWALVALVIMFLGAAQHYSRTARAQSPHVGANAVAWQTLQSAQHVPTSYRGRAETVSKLTSGAVPLAMASADFDGDGIADLVIGYAHSSGGILAVHRGNLDAFAPQSHASWLAIAHEQFPSPFLPQATVIDVPEAPQFVVTGDFSGNGDVGILTGARGSQNLYLFAGNGKGKFSAPQIITLPGALTALAAGQVGARDGKTDVVAGVQTAQAAAVLVYKGSAGGLSQTAVSYPVPQPATQLEIADLHGDGISDVAVLAGGEVLIVHPTAQAGDDTSALIERVPAGSARSIAVGGFVWDRKSRNQLAVLSQSGIVQVLSPEELDTRPFTKEEMHIRRTLALRAQLPSEMNPLWSGESHPWNVVKSGAVSAPMSGNVRLMAAGLAHTRPLDLMVVDSSDSRLHVLPANTTYDNSDDSRELTIETGDAPAAVLPARVNVDGRRGLVMVGRSASHPKTMSPLPDPTYTVNRLDDIAPRGTGVTCITPASTDCTFREAVIKANANAGADTIMLPAGTITLTITGQGEGLAATGDVDVTDSLTIIGTVSSGIPTSIITGGAGWNDKFISVNKEGTSDADLSVSNVIFQNGNNTNLVATELGYDALGGAVAFYGCAAEGGGCTVGSGSSSLSITNVQFLNNSIGNNALTGCSGSANIDCGGGLLSQFGDTTISGSTFTGNKATNGRGGALVLQGAKETMTVTNSKFTGNTSGIEGGAIEIDFQNGFATGIITIHSSTISTNTSGNYTAADGGGLHVNLGNGSAGPGTTATANIDQETVISGNSGDRGGAIVFEGTSGPSPNHTSLTISKVTITGNHATGASSDGGGGIFVPDAGTLNIQYSRIAGNTSAHGGKPTGISIEPVGATINATDNWWGCNTGPSASPCDTVGYATGSSGATITDTPYIILSLGAIPSTLQPQPPGTTSSALTADFLHESSGTIALINIDVLIGLPITFGGTAGSISSPQATIQSNGQATATFTHDATCNASSANATVDTNPAPTVTTPITTVCPDLTATKANSLGVSGATTPLASPNWTWTVTAANGAAGTAPALFTAGETILSDNLPSTNISSYGTPTPSNFVGITNSVNISCGIASNVLTCIASGADVTIGTGGSFKVSFTATATAAGSYTNPTAGSCTVDPNHDIIEFSESNNSCGPDTVMVLAPPVISKVFGGSIPVGGNTSLTFTITNPAVNTVSLLGVGVTDPLPTGLTVATSAPTATCGGTLTTTAPTTITLAGATVAPGVPCVFSVTVTGATPGSYTNTTGNVTSTNGGTGNQASAPLIVKANTTTAVTSSTNPSVFNQSVTFTATVAPVAPGTGTPTGTVNFLDGATTIGTGTLSGGVATFSISTLSVGSHTITTTYGGDANFVGSSGALTGNPQVVNKADTTTAVTSSLNPSSLGQSVTFTATVAVVPPGAAPTVLSATGPTGSVTFLDGGTPIGSGTLSGGVATFTTTALGVGNHTITTSYLGDPNYNGSTGSMTGNPQVVNKGNPATAVTSSVNPSILGQSVTFTATVTAVAPATGTPTGSVTFLDGGSPIGSGTLSGGVATLTTSSLSLGSHTITTSYLGDATFNGSTGSMTGNPQVVNKASTATAVTSSVNPSVVGQSVTFTATVTAVPPGTGTPTGSVTFLDGGSPIGSGTLAAGVATFSTSTLAGGSHTITTSYSGDPSFNGSTGSLTGNPQVVNKANTTTAVTSSTNPSTFGQSVTFTATVTAVAPGTGTPTGSVTFLDGGSPIGSGTLSGGVATLTTSALATGPHTIATNYPGDPSFNASPGFMTGNPQVVNKANTTTSVTSSVNPSGSGQSVTFTATVSPVAPGAGIPTGPVTFLDGGIPIGSGTLSGGVATFTTTALGVGNHTITTSYLGDGNFNGSTGSMTGNPQVVNKGNTTTAVTSSVNPSILGQSVTFTATVTAVAPATGTPTGSVTFLDGGSPIGSGTLSGGVATLTTSSLSLGSHTITTSYLGDATFNGSTGSMTGNPQVVNKASTATTVTSSVNPSVVGQPVTFTATVTAVPPGTGTPTGSVTFLDGGSAIGSGTLSGGVATLTTSALAGGSHTITTSYPGDPSFNGSTGSLTGNPQVVNKANSTTAVTSSLNPSVFGQPVTFTATVAAVAPGTGTPSGSVTFLDGGSPIGSGTLSGGVATFATSALATGPHTITTSYPGDPSFNGSTGVMTGNPQVVSKANTTTAVTSSVNPSVFGQSVTFTATVSPVAPGGGTPTGSVTFLDGGSPIGTGTLSSGIATFSTSALAVASHTITTSYSGDGNFNGSTGSLTGNPQVVNKANSATAVTSSQNPSVVGQPVTFTATVSAAAPGAGTPGGNVTFLDGGSPIGTGTLSGGVATLTTSALTLGSHTITTSYSGDGNFNGSTGSLTGNPQVVTKASSATTVTSTPNPSKLGQSVTFTATVAAVAPGTGTPTGSVTFLNGGSPIGSGPLSGGVATFATSSLPAGNNTITASYPGDGNFNGSTGSLTGNPQVVVAPPTISKAFVPPNILVGGTTALVFTLTNPSANTVAESGVAFSDTLTGGLQVASTPGVITNCGGGFIGATAGSTSLSFSGGAIPVNNSCTVSVNITATSYGLKTNITGPVSSTNGGTGTTSNTATLSVGQPPAFTSANNATFTIGVPGSFTVTTSGAPTPSITESGHLPTGLTFVDNGNGTGTLSGTPLVFIGGDFNISFTAQNGVGSPAVQPFTIILQQAPAFTSANNAVFVYGVPNSFTVTTVGFPVPSIHESGTLPPWLTFVDHGNGTATLSGTPSYTSGTFSLVLTATNVVTTATQNFTLTVSGLSLSPSNLSFGSVYLNSSHTMSVTATNVGSTNVTVSGVGITPGTADAAAYTFVNHCTTPLKPGKSCTIAVTFLADAVGTLTATLNITDNTVGSPQHVSLTGTVIDPVAQFNPTKLTFGTHAVGSSTTLPVQLTNTGQTPLNISNIGVVGTNAGDFSQANNCPAILAPTMSCTISVTFTPTVAGSRTGTLTVTDNVAAGKSTVALTGTGH